LWCREGMGSRVLGSGLRQVETLGGGATVSKQTAVAGWQTRCTRCTLLYSMPLHTRVPQSPSFGGGLGKFRPPRNPDLPVLQNPSALLRAHLGDTARAVRAANRLDVTTSLLVAASAPSLLGHFGYCSRESVGNSTLVVREGVEMAENGGITSRAAVSRSGACVGGLSSSCRGRGRLDTHVLRWKG
jgi:hypothetical protein